MYLFDSMNKKKSYNCSICNTSWECYAFTEFATPFSTCKFCYMDISNIIKKKYTINNRCMLCDTSKECFKIPLTNNPIKPEMMLCFECFSIIKELIEQEDK
jgi:hypothetical protein